MSKRPRLHLADTALALVPKKRWRHHEYCSRLLPAAGRFILTDDASAKLGRIVKNTADLLLRNHQFALPPVLPATYLELNIRLFHEALGAPTTNDSAEFDGVQPDERVGYLVTDNRIIAFSAAADGEAAPTPFSIKRVDSNHRHELLPVAFSPIGYGPEELASKAVQIIRETQEWNRLAILLGSSLHSMPDEETRQAYLTQWAIEHNYPSLAYNDRLYRAGAGELRTAHAIMLVLNQPAIIQMANVSRHIGLNRKGKRQVYASHSVIDIDLGRRKTYRRLFASGTHATPARHRVRGHFVHYHHVKGCDHEWPLVPDRSDPAGWVCRKCRTLRVWKPHFMRGDAAKGFVTNEYNVETQEM